MKPISIIGIGSPFGADQLGWDAVHLLKKYFSQQTIDLKLITLTTLDRPGVGLLDSMGDADNVILIDAVKGGGKPGSIVRLQGDQIESVQSLNSTHGFGVAEALSLAHVLNKLPENLVLIGLEVGGDPEWMPSCENMQTLVEFIVREIDVGIRKPDLQALI